MADDVLAKRVGCFHRSQCKSASPNDKLFALQCRLAQSSANLIVQVFSASYDSQIANCITPQWFILMNSHKSHYISLLARDRDAARGRRLLCGIIIVVVVVIVAAIVHLFIIVIVTVAVVVAVVTGGAITVSLRRQEIRLHAKHRHAHAHTSTHQQHYPSFIEGAHKSRYGHERFLDSDLPALRMAVATKPQAQNAAKPSAIRHSYRLQ
jgi:hypothetical protein